MTKGCEWVVSIFRILPNKYLSSEAEVKGTFPSLLAPPRRQWAKRTYIQHKCDS